MPVAAACFDFHVHGPTHPTQVLQELVRLDEQELNNKYKIGVIYCKPGQETEEEMYNNGGCGLESCDRVYVCM